METFIPLSGVIVIFHVESLLHGSFNMEPPFIKKTRIQHLAVDAEGRECTYRIEISKILEILSQQGIKIAVIHNLNVNVYELLALLDLDKHISYSCPHSDNLEDVVKSIHNETRIPRWDTLMVLYDKESCYSKATESAFMATIHVSRNENLNLSMVEAGLRKFRMLKETYGPNPPSNIPNFDLSLRNNLTDRSFLPRLIVFSLEDLIQHEDKWPSPPLSKKVLSREVLINSKGQEITYYTKVPESLEYLIKQGMKIAIIDGGKNKIQNLDEILASLNLDKYISYRFYCTSETEGSTLAYVHAQTGISVWNMIYIVPPAFCSSQLISKLEYQYDIHKRYGIVYSPMEAKDWLSPRYIQNYFIDRHISLRREKGTTLMPKLIVFGLNDICWPFFSFRSNELEEYLKISPSFIRNISNNRIFGRNGKEIKYIEPLPYILRTLRNDNVKISVLHYRRHKNKMLDDVVKNLFTVLEFDKYISYYITNLDESSVLDGFVGIQKQSNVPYEEMLYFDILDSGTKENNMEGILGVVTQKIGAEGLTLGVVKAGIGKFAVIEEERLRSIRSCFPYGVL